jgi:Chaperone for flagella basal body P-ring formation
MKRIALCLGLFFLGAQPAFAGKPMPDRKIAHNRILVGDVVDNAPASIASIDLGPAPVPGSSRVVRREDVEQAVADVTQDKIKIPAAVRIERKTKTLSVTDLERTTQVAVAAFGVARGATWSGARPAAAITIPDGYDIVTADVPKPPRRSGKFTTIATLSFLENGVELARAQVPIDLDLPKDAALADVRKGAKVTFVVTRGSVEIRASGTAATDADVGEEVQVLVNDMGHTLRGKLMSREPAIVSEGL